MSENKLPENQFVDAWRDTAAYLEANYAYDPAQGADVPVRLRHS